MFVSIFFLQNFTIFLQYFKFTLLQRKQKKPQTYFKHLVTIFRTQKCFVKIYCDKILQILGEAGLFGFFSFRDDSYF